MKTKKCKECGGGGTSYIDHNKEINHPYYDDHMNTHICCRCSGSGKEPKDLIVNLSEIKLGEKFVFGKFSKFEGTIDLSHFHAKAHLKVAGCRAVNLSSWDVWHVGHLYHVKVERVPNK